jgi:hypothetical protein
MQTDGPAGSALKAAAGLARLGEKTDVKTLWYFCDSKKRREKGRVMTSA